MTAAPTSEHAEDWLDGTPSAHLVNDYRQAMQRIVWLQQQLNPQRLDRLQAELELLLDKCRGLELVFPVLKPEPNPDGDRA